LVTAADALALPSSTGNLGTWSQGVEVFPSNAAADPEVFLPSVSCPSAGNCSAVGTYNDSAGHEQGLLLDESSGTWSQGVEASLPSNAGTDPNVTLSSVSCPSAGNCSAVGYYTDSAGHEQGLLLDESSDIWSPGVEALLPSNTGTNEWPVLNSVSCPSAGNCSAVGTYNDSAGHEQGLLLDESSGIWSQGVEALLPSNAGTDPEVLLPSVSCPSAGNCSAVGYYAVSAVQEQGLLLDESSGTWSRGTEAPLPSGAIAFTGGRYTLAPWSSVSCASAGNCSAVGYYVNNFGSQGFLLDKFSGTWSQGIEVRPPSDAISDPMIFLNSLSCPSAGNCSAVGSYNISNDTTSGLLLDESSGTWSQGVEAPRPSNASTDEFTALNSVSCPSAGNCSAVGLYPDSAGHGQGLLLDESSGTWSQGVEAPLPSNAGTDPGVDLESVSCPSVGNCSAVGTYNDSSGNEQGLLLDESSGIWSQGVEALLPFDTDEDYVSLSSVSCASAGNCSAVGTYNDSSGYVHGLLLSESSGTWSQGVEAPLPPNAGADLGVALSSVSCASAGNCSAVGYYYDSTYHRQGLLLKESSGIWSRGVKAPLPSSARTDPGVALSSISCSSAGNCSAVGTYNDSAGHEQGLLLKESSGIWSRGVKAPLPSNAGTDPGVALSSISCSSAGNCSAVGDYYDSSGNEQGLLLRESSGTWSQGVRAPLPSNAGKDPAVALSSVSCASVTLRLVPKPLSQGNYCSAVGKYADSSGNEQGLLLRESSGTWSQGVEAPLPSNAGTDPGVVLTSVSCSSVPLPLVPDAPSQGNCSAVGDYSDSSGNEQGLLLGAFSGSKRWAQREAPLPSNAGKDPAVALSSVSCSSAGNCSAVGRYTVSSSNGQGFLLGESSGTWSQGVEASLPSNARTDPYVSLSSVSCASVGNCSAVGHYDTAGDRDEGLLLNESAAQRG
jgi:hypothetical protein